MHCTKNRIQYIDEYKKRLNTFRQTRFRLLQPGLWIDISLKNPYERKGCFPFFYLMLQFCSIMDKSKQGKDFTISFSGQIACRLEKR